MNALPAGRGESQPDLPPPRIAMSLGSLFQCTDFFPDGRSETLSSPFALFLERVKSIPLWEVTQIGGVGWREFHAARRPFETL